MALRTWLRAITTAFGVAAFAGAVQLGAGYGLQLVRLRRDFTGPAADFWPTQLTWLAWFAVVATAVGARVAQRVAEGDPNPHRRTSPVRTAVRRIVLALVATTGAGFAVIGLSVLPAQASTGVDDPVTVTALIGGIGAVVGLPAALAALAHPAMRWNLLVFSGALWLLAVGSAAPALWAGETVAEIRPGVLESGLRDAGDPGWQLYVLLPVLALVLGAVVGGLARWRAVPTLATAVSGMAGPAVLDAAYLAAGAGSHGPYQDDPYWAALLAVAAGAVGSIVVAAVRRPGRPAGTATGTSAPAVGAADGSVESREPAPEISLSEKISAESTPFGRVSPVPAAPTGPEPTGPEPIAADPPTPGLTAAELTRSGPAAAAASPVPVAAQSHPGDRPPPTPAAVTPRVDPTPVATGGPPTPTPTPLAGAVERPTPQPVAPPPVAPPPTVAPPAVAPPAVAPATGRIPRPRFMRQRRPAPPPALTDEDADHVDWVSELRRQPGRTDGRSRSGADGRSRDRADGRPRRGADDQANGR